MDQSRESLPEGTDAIIPGAAVEGEAGDGFALAHSQKFDPIPLDDDDDNADDAGSLKDEAVRVVGEKTAGIRDQATEKVRAFAVQGKDRATDAIDNVVRMVEDAAGQIDDKVGAQYGDYVRRAGETLAGVATTLRDKDVDDLLDDARGVVRSSPAIAIGAAAAVGFLLARIAKAGATPSAPADEDASTPGSTKA